MRKIKLQLPVPPSTNNYYRSYRGRAIISRRGRDFAKEVKSIVLKSKIEMLVADRIKVRVLFVQPDRRKRDIDNFCTKALLDAMQKAGLYDDDAKIYKLICEKIDFDERGVLKAGVYVDLEELEIKHDF